MKTVTRAIALVLAISVGARAEEGSKGTASHSGGGGGGGHGHGSGDSGLFLFDLFLNLFIVGAEVAAIENAVATAPPPPEGWAQRTVRDDDDPPPRFRAVQRRRYQAREGLLLSFGLGGGSMWVSSQDPARTGAFDLDFRLGYGFSDRFQFFMDLGLDAANYRSSVYARTDDVASWTFTFRGQTVLLGDRQGNGLNLNLGIGLGGITTNSGYVDQYSSPTGLALAGGLSYDARVSPWFAFSPEFFYTWHAIPDVPGQHHVAQVYGLRINFLWYLR